MSGMRSFMLSIGFLAFLGGLILTVNSIVKHMPMECILTCGILSGVGLCFLIFFWDYEWGMQNHPDKYKVP